MEVRTIMTPRPVTVGPDEPIAAAARLLERYNLGAVPVCDAAGRLRGMVTDRDIALRCVALGTSPSVRVGEIMSRNIAAVAPGDTVAEAAGLMAARQVRRGPGGGFRQREPDERALTEEGKSFIIFCAKGKKTFGTNIQLWRYSQ